MNIFGPVKIFYQMITIEFLIEKDDLGHFDNSSIYYSECTPETNMHILMGECNTILSAYTLYRHLG